MIGPIFMFIAVNNEHYDWGETLGCMRTWSNASIRGMRRQPSRVFAAILSSRLGMRPSCFVFCTRSDPQGNRQTVKTRMIFAGKSFL